MSRHDRVKLKKWLSKLDELKPDSEWQITRNKYTKMLYLMCQCEVIRRPFDQFPPSHDLQPLHHYQECKIIKSIEAEVEKENKMLGICTHCEEIIKGKLIKTNKGQKDEIYTKIRHKTEKSLSTTLHSCLD